MGGVWGDDMPAEFVSHVEVLGVWSLSSSRRFHFIQRKIFKEGKQLVSVFNMLSFFFEWICFLYLFSFSVLRFEQGVFDTWFGHA